MIDKLTDFEEIENYIKGSGLGFREALMAYYTELGEKLGFTIRKGSSVIRHTLNLGKLDLVWVEPNIVFCCEFGDFTEILKHLWRVYEFQPALAILLLSSGSSCKPTSVAKLIEETPLLSDMKDRIYVLDIKGREITYPRL